MKRTSFCLATAMLALSCTAHAHDDGYRVVERLALGGEGGWDYPSIDAAAHRLYLSRGDHVQIVDTISGNAIGAIPETPGVHGIALAIELGRGYISCGKANQVKVFDLKTNAVIATVATGENPDAILFEPSTRRVFAFNGRSKNATVIDANTHQVVATIPLGGKPEFARADGKGGVFVNIEDTAQLVVMDARRAAVKSTFTLPHCEEPTGLALDAEHRRSFSTCSNRTLAVLDIDSGKSIASLAIGEGPDGAEYDATTRTVTSANGEGTVTTFRELTPDRYTEPVTSTTQRGARTLALDPATHRLYLPTAQFGAIPADTPHARPPVLKDSFVVLVIDRASQGK